MSLSENLKLLRKQRGMSQEQLAEQLGVSRQAVSKWESNSGMPEMETLISLSEIFECSIDELLKSDLKDQNLANKQKYENHYNLMAKVYTFGITAILLGVCAYLFAEIYFPENTYFEFIPQIIFLFFVLIGVICFVYFGIVDSHFEERKITLSDFYSEGERNVFNQKYSLAIATGVGLILLGVVVQLMVSNLYNEDLANGLFMLLVTIAVGVFVYFGTLKGKYDRVDEKLIAEEKENKKASMYCGIIMMVVTIIYLWWSFTSNDWGITWIVYPIGGIVCGIVFLYFEGIKE